LGCYAGERKSVEPMAAMREAMQRPNLGLGGVVQVDGSMIGAIVSLRMRRTNSAGDAIGKI
jgi:hypothetical protein